MASKGHLQDVSSGKPPPRVIPDVYRIGVLVRRYQTDQGEERFDGQVTVGKVDPLNPTEDRKLSAQEHAESLMCAQTLLDRFIESTYPDVYEQIKMERLQKIAGEDGPNG